MAARSGPTEQAGVDWRRLASDRNVAPDIAKGLWERASATSPDDPQKSERAFKRMLEEAAAANVTPEPGRETLVDAKGADDPASLGPGKVTRVLEEQKGSGPADAAKPKADKDGAAAAAAGGAATPDAAKPTGKASPEGLRTELSAAVAAGKNAAEVLAKSDPATIVQALKDLRDTEGPGVLQKLMSAAGTAIERIMDARGADAAGPAGAPPVGDKVKIDAGPDEQHTQYVDDAGEAMMASTPRPVSQRIEDWKKYVSEQPAPIQAKVAGEITRAQGLSTSVTDLTKKAKAGDAAAKTALTDAQKQLAASIAAIGRQIPPEPEKKPAAPTPGAPGAAPPVAGAPGAPPPGVAPPDPAAPKPPPDPLAVKAADDLFIAAFRMTGGKVPAPITAMDPQARVDESAKPAPDLRKAHYPTFESLAPVMSPVAVEKSTQLAMETGLEKGAEKLPATFKTQAYDSFVADTFPKAANFETLFNEIAKAGGPDGKYMMRGKPLSAADFDAAVPGDMSLARVINVDGAFTKFLNSTDAEAAYVAKFPGSTPTSEELTAFVMTEAQANAPDAINKYVSPKIVDFPSWLFPEPDIKSDAVFSQYCDLLALYANWYPQGHLRMVVKRAAVSAKVANQQLRKPTVFDGTLSPLWMQRNNRDHNWGKTGGGIREALMKVDWADIDHGKWVLAVVDPKYKAVLDAAKAAAAKKAKAAEEKLLAEHQKAMEAQSAKAQGEQRKDDAAAPGAPSAPAVAGSAPAAPGSAPPAPGSAPPAPGSAPPAPGSAPPVAGSAPPAPGSAPPVAGSAPPAPGSAPPAPAGSAPPAPPAPAPVQAESAPTPIGSAPATPAKPDVDPNKSKHAAGPAPAGWQAQVVNKVPSEQVAPDDPGHTYHLLKDGSAVSTTEPLKLAEPQAAAVRAKASTQIEMTPAETLASKEFTTFSTRYAGLVAEFQLPADPNAAKDIWLTMVTTLQKTDAAYKAQPDLPNSTRKDLTADAFKAIMKEFDPVIAKLSSVMEAYSAGKKVWGFWSGKPALDAAKANAEVCLEKSALGGLFDGININGNWDTQMWASLSAAYASFAAKDAEKKTYLGFCGVGSSAEQSIFNKIEQPQFMSMLDKKAAANLKLSWYAVAFDPKDGKTLDPNVAAGGMTGAMYTGARADMAAKAEKIGPMRVELFKKTGKVVAPDEAEAELARLTATQGAPPDGAIAKPMELATPAPVPLPPAPAPGAQAAPAVPEPVPLPPAPVPLPPVGAPQAEKPPADKQPEEQPAVQPVVAAPPPPAPPPVAAPPVPKPAAPEVPAPVALPPLEAAPPPAPPKAPAADPKLAAPPVAPAPVQMAPAPDAAAAKDAAAPQEAPSPNTQVKAPGGKDPGGPDKAPVAPAPPPLPPKDPAEEQLEQFVKAEIAVLTAKNFSAATKANVTGLVNDLGAFELGLQLHVGKYAKNPAVAEAKAFLSDKRSALEDVAHKLFQLAVLGKTKEPKLDAAGFKELEALKSEIAPWLAAFKKDTGMVSGVALCNDMINEVDKGLAAIITHRDKLLKAAKTAIDGVDVNNPGNAIKDEIAKVQIWLDAGHVPDPGSLRVQVDVAKTIKEEDIKKAADAKAAEAAKAAAAPKPGDAKAAEPKPPEDPAKAPAQAQPAQAGPEAAGASPEAKQPTDQEKALLEAEKKKLELELVEEQLDKLMENALKPAEVLNAASSVGLSAAVLLAHLAPAIAIPAILGKAGIMFYTKYAKKKALLKAKTQLTLLSPEQIHDLAAVFDKPATDFQAALEEVDRAAKMPAIATGAGGDTAKKEGVPLGIDAVEVATALSGIHEGVIHLMHVGASVTSALVAGYQARQTFKHAAHHAEKVKSIKAAIALIDTALGKPSLPPAAPAPEPAGEALVLPPVPAKFASIPSAPPKAPAAAPPPVPKAPAPEPAAGPTPEPPPAPAPAVAPPVATPGAPDPAAAVEAPTEAAPADPIVVPTSMAGTPHTLRADPKTGKVEFNSIFGFAVAKLQSILDLVPPNVRAKVADALADASEAAALVVDPRLKEGAKSGERPGVMKSLGDILRSLAVKIRIIGETGKLTDADPAVAKQVQADEEARKVKMAQPPEAAPAAPAAPAPAAPAAATAAAAPDAAAKPAAAATPDAASTPAPASTPDAASKPDAAPANANAAPAAAKADAPGAPAPANAPAGPAADKADAKADAPAAPAAPSADAKDGAAPAPGGKDPAAPPPPPPTGATVEEPAGPPPPLEQEPYNAHLRSTFAGEIKELDTLHEQFKAQDAKGARESQALALAAADIEKLNTELKALKEGGASKKQIVGKQKQIEAQQSVIDQGLVGMTMPQLYAEAEKLRANVTDAAKKTQASVERLEAIMNASIILGTQIDGKSAKAARTLYDVKIDQTENKNLLAMAKKAKIDEKRIAELACEYRNWGKEWVRREIMRDEKHREILFLRDLAAYGNPNGLTVDAVKLKEIKKLPLSKEVMDAVIAGDYTSLTDTDWKAVYAGMIGSAGTANPAVSGNAGVKQPGQPDAPPPPAAATPTEAPAPTAAPPTPAVDPTAKADAAATPVAPPATAAPTGKADGPAGDAPAAAPDASAAKADAPAAKAEAPVTKVEPPPEKASGAPAPAAPAAAPNGAPTAAAPPAPNAAPNATPDGAAPTAAPNAAPTAAAPPAPNAAPNAAPTAAPNAPAPTAPTVAPNAAPDAAAPTAAPPAPVAPAPGAATPEAPAHTPAQSMMELASVTSATIPQGKGEPHAKLTLVPGAQPSMVHKSDSPDPIRIKDELITLVKEYLAFDGQTPSLPANDPQRELKLAAIEAKFTALRKAMAYARGEDSQLTTVRAQFEKFIGVKATSNAWPQGHDGLNRMATQAKLMIFEQKTKTVGDARTVDAKLQGLAATDPRWAAAIGGKLGTDINIGFAGAVSKEYDAVIAALTSGSMVQKAQTLINFAENFVTKDLLGPDSRMLMDRVVANIAATQEEAGQRPEDFKLGQRIENMKTSKPVKGLMSDPAFLDKMEGQVDPADKKRKGGLKGENAGVDAQRDAQEGGPLQNKSKASSDNTALGGDMDTKMAQQPVETLDEAQLDFLANQGQPKVDFTAASSETDPVLRKAAKVAALKAAGIHLSKAPGLIPEDKGGGVFPPFGQGAPAGVFEPAKDTAGMVDATSIVPDADRAVADKVTVKDGETGKDQTYIEGKAENIVDPMHSWIRTAREAHAPLKAGISGTTARFAGAAQMLGATKHQAVIAMIGHLQEIEAHSFWEIVDGAGLPMAAGKYTPFSPNPEGMESAGAEFAKNHVLNLGPDDAEKKKKAILGQE